MNLPFALPVIPPRLRRPLLYAGYTAFTLFVAVLTFYGAVPRDRVKDRLETALSADPSAMNPLGTGMDVTIGDLGLTLFSGPGVVGKDGIFKTRPLDPSVKPTRWFVDDATVHIGLLGLLFNRPSYSWKGHAMSGAITGKWSASPELSRLKLGLSEVVLDGVQAVQSALMGLPLNAKIDGQLEIELPKQLIADSAGKIDFTLDDVVLGDGKAKLTVATDPFLAAGVTVPRIKLGKLEAHVTIEHGRARLDDVRLHSAEADATLEGYIELHDPISSSQLHAYLRFRPSEALAKREPTIELLMNAMSRAKRSDGYLGFALSGSFMLPSLVPATEPPPGVSSHSAPRPAVPTTVTAPPPPPPGGHAVPPPPAEVAPVPPPVEPPPAPAAAPPPPPAAPTAAPAAPPAGAPAPGSTGPGPVVPVLPPPPQPHEGEEKEQPTGHTPLRLIRGEHHADDTDKPDKPAEPAEPPKNE
jgi:type II secretion system protein N